MKSQPHIVNKVSIELTLPSADEERQGSEQAKIAIQNAVEKLDPMLEAHFGDSFYRVDKLSVGLSIHIKDLSQLEYHLQKALTQEIEARAAQTDTTARISETPFEKQTPENHRQDLLRFFLQTGHFPWWAGGVTRVDLEKKLQDMPSQDWLTFIQPLIRENHEIIPRLATQFPNDIVKKLIKKSGGKSLFVEELYEVIIYVNEFLSSQKLAYGMQQKIAALFCEQALSGILLNKPHQSIKSKIVATVLKSFSDTEIDFFAMKERLWKSDITNKKSWIDAIERGLTGKQDKSKKSNKEPKDDKDIWERTRKNKRQEVEKELNISNSGLVLLHPFLKSFFENLGLLDEDDFTDSDKCERAVCLLHYLATGDTEFFEPDLVLPKFLCGWPGQHAVNRFLPISDYEKEECQVLLTSVVNHWEALKTTSIDELRSNFLQRNGLLREEEFGWSLYVERKTQDILLEKLPWGLSIVKHKWMNEFLTVKW